MLISVIIPFYKELDLIGRAVDSIFTQAVSGDCVEFEVLIGNDGELSEDEIISAIPESWRQHIKVMRNNGPKGPGGARNCAIDAAKGECLAFLDADDFWLQGKISSQLALYRNGYNFIATAYRFSDVDVAVLPPRVRDGIPLDVFKRLGIGTSTVFIARELLGDARFRDLRFAQDIDLWYRLSMVAGYRFIGVNNCTVVYSRSGSTKNKLIQARYLLMVLSLNNVGFFNKLNIMFRYSIRGVLNHILR